MLKNILIVVAIIIIVLFITAIFIGASMTPKIEIPDQISESELQPLLQKIVNDNNLPGLGAAVIDANGVRHIATAGVRKMGSESKVTDQDLFHLGSCTKAMTSAMIAMLIDEGTLTWETTFIEVYPELASEVHQNFHEVTIHELLTHNAGMYPNPSNMWGYQDQEIKERRLSVIKEALKDSSRHKRGKHLYSNLGYMLAGSMAEKLTGKSWEELSQEKLFDPLQMASAGFGIPGTIEKEDQPWGHNNIFGFGKWNPTQGDNAQTLGPAGTVHANLEDWGKFISFLMLQDSSAISNTQKEKLLTPINDDYACGWVVAERSWSDGTVYWHNGSNTMNYALTWVAPTNNRAYLVCTNSYDTKSANICDSIIGILMKVDGDKTSE